MLLAVAMTWPLALHLGSDIGADLGDPLLQAWQVAWIGHALLHQPLDFFQANIFWPLSDTLAFSDALVGYAPAGLLAQQGPHAALVVYNVLFLFAYALAFLGAYLLARELSGSWVAGLAAGVAFAYAPWRLAQNGHLHVISSGGIPLALFLLVRGYRRGSARLVLGGWLVAAWQMTLGFTLGLQLAYLLGVLAVIAALAWLLRKRPRPAPAVVRATAAGVLVLALVTALQAQPYLRVVDEHPEARRTPFVVAAFSPPIRGFVTAPAESFVWGDATTRWRTSFRAPAEQTLFPGLTIALLALAGAVASVYPRRLRVGLVAGVAVCAALSFGLREDTFTPYRLLYELGPGWDGVRTPGRINTLTSLGLALLAGAGLLAVTRYAGRVRAAAAVTGALLVGAMLLEGLGPLEHPRVPPPPPGQRLARAPQLHLPWNFEIDSRYAYWSTAGFPAIVNGSGGFDPTRLNRLRPVVDRFPDARSIAALRRLGVRTVVLHPGLTRGTAWEDAARRPAGPGVERQVADGVVLYRLRPVRDDRAPALLPPR